MTIGDVHLSESLVAGIVSITVGTVIPLLLKIIQRRWPWLTIDNQGSHAKRAPEDDPE